MRRTMAVSILIVSSGLAVLAPQVASAQEASEQSSQTYPAAPEPATTQEAEPLSPVQAPPPTELEAPMTERQDRPRFRGGVGLTFGGEFFSDYDYSAMLFGVDGRMGVQINDLIGVYFAPHLSAGGKRGTGYTGATATLGALVMVDFTFLDALFVGAGAGYMVFNNPNGPALAFRVGGYPVKGFAKSGPRRRGLVVSLETRIGFMGEFDGNGVQIMGAVGYEKY